jgi:DNA repair protein RecO (recombination protein O)
VKQLSTKAIVLKRLNFGEADRIVTALTPEQGRIGLLAKGARKPKSKLAGGLELFAINDITYIEGRGELKTVISTRIHCHFRNIMLDITKTMVAYDILKEVDKKTTQGVEDGIYEITETALECLNIVDLSSNIIFVWFTSQILLFSGDGINIEKPLNQAKFENNKKYSFSYDDMSFVENERGEFSPNHIKFLRLVIKSGNPRKLNLIEGASTIADDLVVICKQILKINKA